MKLPKNITRAFQLQLKQLPSSYSFLLHCLSVVSLYATQF